jgi:hypothetical protein
MREGESARITRENGKKSDPFSSQPRSSFHNRDRPLWIARCAGDDACDAKFPCILSCVETYPSLRHWANSGRMNGAIAAGLELEGRSISPRELNA